MTKKGLRNLKWIMGFLSTLVLIILYQSLNFDRISSKVEPDSIRIGYLNLNKSLIDQTDLKDMIQYGCDIWLLLEWNGNNFNESNYFDETYKRSHEIIDTFTYGFMVLAKQELNVQVREFDQKSRPYKCDYPKLLIELDSLQIGFLHAPPPVPICGYETKEYIKDALNGMNTNRTNQILIGDFNTTMLNESYKNLTNNGYIDAFKDDGFFKGTFGFKSYLPNWLRIDYCFTKGNIEVVNRWRFPTTNSDHCGIIVDLNIENCAEH